MFLLNGFPLHQKVIYETLPKFCTHCHVLGHSRLLYPKVVAYASTETRNHILKDIGHDSIDKGSKDICNQANARGRHNAKGSVFSRLGPHLPQGTPISTVQQVQTSCP